MKAYLTPITVKNKKNLFSLFVLFLISIFSVSAQYKDDFEAWVDNTNTSGHYYVIKVKGHIDYNLSSRDDELDIVQIYYKDENGNYDYNKNWRGDCENNSDLGWNWYQRENDMPDLFGYQSDYTYTVTDIDGNKHKICYLKFYYNNLPSQFDRYKYLNFLVKADWDPKADDDNLGIDREISIEVPNLRSKHYYDQSDIEITASGEDLTFDILGQCLNVDRHDDELKDIDIYFKDQSGSYILAFSGDYEYSSDTGTDIWRSTYQSAYASIDDSYKEEFSRYVSQKRGKVRFYSNKLNDLKVLDFKVVVNWYTDQDDQTKNSIYYYTVNNPGAQYNYSDNDIKFTASNNKLDINILGQSYNPGYSDDELDDLKMHFTLPGGTEQLLLHAGCDNNDKFEMDTSDIAAEDLKYIEKMGNDILDGDTATGFIYADFNYLIDSIADAPEYVDIRADYDWDINSNEANAGMDGTFYYRVRTGVYTKFVFDNNSQKIIIDCDLGHLQPPSADGAGFVSFNDEIKWLRVVDANKVVIGNKVSFENYKSTFYITANDYDIDTEETYTLEFLDDQDNILFKREHKFTPVSKPLELSVINEGGGNTLSWPILDAYTDIQISRQDESGIWQNINNNVSKEADNIYKDNFNLKSCTQYIYRINYKIDGKDFSTDDTYIVTPSQEEVQIVNFDASKLEFPDKIALTWERQGEGLINYYKIQRKIAGQESSLQTVFISDDQNVTSFIDEQTQPGILYEYSIAGYSKCDVAVQDTFSITAGTTITWDATTLNIGNDNYTYKNIDNVKFGTQDISSPYTAGSDSTLTVSGIKEQESITGPQKAAGIRQPLGTINGQITFGQGSPVEDVKVVVEDPENDSKCLGMALKLSGNDSITIPHYRADGKALPINNGYILEAWIKSDNTASGTDTLMAKGKWKLTIDNATGELAFNNTTFSVDTAFDAKIYNHFAVKASESGVSLILNDSAYNEIPVADVLNDTSNFVIGKGFNGVIDEIRLWNETVSEKFIKENYFRLLNGNEAGLAGYWRLDEGISTMIIDMSQDNNTFMFNKNHGKHNATPIEADIASSKLGLCGISDKYGNYSIHGIGFKGLGQSYIVVPMKGIHTFNPGNRPVYISSNNLNPGSQDFIDISSFPVSGVVKYKGYEHPVKDVSLLIDGNPAIGDDNKPVVTDENGEFTVSVPIGYHKLSIKKDGHTFESSYYLERLSDGSYTDNVYFNSAIEGITFYDTTKVKLAGRVVGGLTEGNKTLGFGLSKNNIGVAEITLQAISDKMDISTEKGQQNFYVFTTDSSSGEYVRYLLPEKYIISSVKPQNSNNVFSFSEDDYGILDLTQAWKNIDTTYLYNDSVVTDTFTYNVSRNFIYRSHPSIYVTNIDNGDYLFEKEIYTGDDTIPMIDENGKYVFGWPVLKQNKEYRIKFSAYEKYENKDTGAEYPTDSVPVTDGRVMVTTTMANDHKEAELLLDTYGCAIYDFTAGDPNFSVSNETDSLDYLQHINAAFIINNNQYDWNGTYAYILGYRPSGSNFVTDGQIYLDFILRDPPGDASYAYIEKGGSIEHSYTHNDEDGISSETSFTASLGGEVTIVTGPPSQGIIIETDNTLDITVGANIERTWTDEDEFTTTTSFDQTISTSDDPAYVGSMADVFIGHSTNIIYGITNVLSVERIDKDNLLDTISAQYNGYTIGKINSIAIGEQFATQFAYTQNHIENYLIPNLEELRNNFLRNNPRYISKQTENSELYGKNNSNGIDSTYLKITYDGKTDSVAYYIDGNNYMYYPYTTGIEDSIANWDSQNLTGDEKTARLSALWSLDSVRWCNEAIRGWEELLKDNEREKVESKLGEFYIAQDNLLVDITEADNDDYNSLVDSTKKATYENISFDAGTSIESSVFIEKGHNVLRAREITFSPYLGATVGYSFNKFGSTTSEQVTYVNGDYKAETQNNIQNLTVGFVLADSDQGDYYTVDIKKDDSGNGPVFSVKGGQSSCPYQDVEMTKYYEPGLILNNATMAVEGPVINLVSNSTVTGVPNDKPAIYEITLGNETETGIDNWYLLMVDPQSNRYGAVVSVGGVNLSQELAVFIPANTSLTKVVEVTKPANSDTTGNINLILHSMCQFNQGDVIEDIADTVTIRAYFEPVCSDIDIVSPGDKWIVNSDDNRELNVVMGNYDNQLSTFERIDLQYRPVTSSQWITQYTWFKDTVCNTYKELAGSGQLPSSYGFINKASSLSYNFDMTPLNNGGYQLQAVSICTDGSINHSDAINGIFDNKRPQLHGIPEPGDGILSPGDVISIRFDEQINESAIFKDYNIDVRGVLNDSPVDDGVSVQFDGNSSYATTGKGLLLNNKPFTIEFKALFDNSTEGAVLTYGNEHTPYLTLVKVNGGFDILLNGNTFSVDTETGDKWNHYAIRYDGKETLALLKNGNVEAEFTVSLKDAFANADMIVIGKNTDHNSFKGNMHNLRVWGYARTDGQLYANMNNSLSANEYGMMSYYPMSEGHGSLFEDITGSRHAEGHGTSWTIEPGSKSFVLDGESALVMDCSSIPINKLMDFTMEMWIKAGSGSNGKVLLSNGKVSEQNLDSDNSKIITVQFTYDGKLEVLSDNTVLTSKTVVTDDQWHHFAFTVNRSANAILYIDGNFEASEKGDELGSVETGRIALGARMEFINDTATNYSDFYSGNIDEVRLWSSARPQELIAKYSHCRLNGNETGLLAYYPFETTSGGTVLTTLNDLVDDNDIVLGAYGNISYSDLNPGIKAQNGISEVGFSYTVNNDEIIVTPNADQASLIENCTLEISVKDIRDMHDNKLASPVTWTAYIEQNSIKWEDKEINISRGVNEEISFETYIKNSGGNYENFSISNLPTWLSGDTENGVLGPGERKKITFTIDKGLNIGKYSEEIFLAGNMSFNERLTVDVEVKGDEPDWKVSGNYSSEMNVVATLSVGGIVSKDENDIVAAFVNDECRGVAHVKYLDKAGEYLVLLTIYGENNGEKIIFKVFDASTGRVFSDVSPVIGFAVSKVEGTFSSPVEIVCGSSIQQAITLNQGWSWISFNTAMDKYASVDELLSNIPATDGDRMVYDNASPAQFATYGDDKWVSTIEKIMPGELYRLNVVKGGTLLYEGPPLAPEDFTLTISSGWNRIGYIPQVNMSVEEALSGYDATDEDIIKGRHGFAIYNGHYWLGNLEFLEPNHGYMLKRQGSNPVSFTFPSTTSLKAGAIANDTHSNPGMNNFEYSFSVLAKLDGEKLKDNDEIIAYINDDIRGIAVKGENNLLYATVYGENKDIGKDISFKLKRGDEVISLSGGCFFEGNKIKGSFANPVMLTMEDNPDNIIEVSAYPNPFEGSLYLQVLLTKSMALQYKIVSTAGSVLYKSASMPCYPGVNKFPVNANNLSKGVYYIHVSIGDKVRVLKIVKK